MYRVPVLSSEGKPLMPTKPSRARRWIKEGKAVGKFNKLGQFYVQLLVEPLNSKTQPISVGIDPGKRINRKLPFHLRAHRQKRFDNRKQGKLAPSIRANRQLELRVIQELCKMFPITDIYFEYVKADVDLTSLRKKAKSGKGFSAVMVGQKCLLKQLKKLGNVHSIYGWQTSNLRKYIRLEKSKQETDFVGATIY